MDQTSDASGAELYRLAQLYSAPDFVKVAKQEELRADGRTPPHAYAWPQRRLFPLHTKAATWASYAFFLEKKASFRRVDAECIEERILHAAVVHGVLRSCHALKEAAVTDRPRTEAELPDDDFALVWANEDGTKERHMPMRNSVEVKRAAVYLTEHRDRLTYEDARHVAGKVLAKATEHGAGLGEHAEFVEKVAGYGACTTASAVELLRSRVAVSRRGPGELNEFQQEMLKLASLLEEKPAQLRSADTREKVARVVDRFDEVSGLRSLVRDGKLSRVEDVIFALTRTKMAAAAAEHTQTITGNVYRLDDVERVKLATIRDELGDEVAREMTADGLHVSGEKAAAVIPTLPRGDAAAFDRLMTEAGLAPAGKQASAGQTRLTNDYLQEMARSHPKFKGQV